MIDAGGDAVTAAESHDLINGAAGKDTYVDTLNLWVRSSTFMQFS